jgi:hypothetical protein
MHGLSCLGLAWIVSYFFGLRIFMLYLFEDCGVLVG